MAAYDSRARRLCPQMAPCTDIKRRKREKRPKLLLETGGKMRFLAVENCKMTIKGERKRAGKRQEGKLQPGAEKEREREEKLNQDGRGKLAY